MLEEDRKRHFVELVALQRFYARQAFPHGPTPDITKLRAIYARYKGAEDTIPFLIKDAVRRHKEIAAIYRDHKSATEEMKETERREGVRNVPYLLAELKKE